MLSVRMVAVIGRDGVALVGPRLRCPGRRSWRRGRPPPGRATVWRFFMPWVMHHPSRWPGGTLHRIPRGASSIRIVSALPGWAWVSVIDGHRQHHCVVLDRDANDPLTTSTHSGGEHQRVVAHREVAARPQP